ncbi:MAG: UbiA family prenyltransferase [Thermoprotei archaeon]
MSLSQTVVDYLRVFRAHTAPATQALVLLPSMLSGVRSPTHLLLLFIIACLIHYSGFGHNSVMDYYFDVNDPHKAHHPIVAGRIPLSSASTAVLTLQAITAIIASTVIYMWFTPLNLIFFLLYVVFGHFYNDFFSKLTAYGSIPISLSMTTLFLSFLKTPQPYVAVTVYVFTTILYEISVEGDLKDISVDHMCLLKKLGVKPLSNEEFMMSRRATIYTYTTATAKTIALATTYTAIRGLTAGITTLIITLPLFTYLNHKITGSARNNKLYAITEVVSIYAPLGILSPPIPLALTIIISGIAYYTVMNKIMWGTILTPLV